MATSSQGGGTNPDDVFVQRCVDVESLIPFVRRKVDLVGLTERIVNAIFYCDMAQLRRLVSPNLTSATPFDGQLAQRDGLFQFANALRRKNALSGTISAIQVRPFYAGKTVDRRHFCVAATISVRREGMALGKPYSAETSYQWQFIFSRSGKLIELRVNDQLRSSEYPLRLTEEDYHHTKWDKFCNTIEELGGIISKLRALAVAICLLGILMLVPGQSPEALRVAFEDLSSRGAIPWDFVASAAAFAVVSYIYGFVALTTRRNNEPGAQIGPTRWNLRLLVLISILTCFWVVISWTAMKARSVSTVGPSPIDGALLDFALGSLVLGASIALGLFKFSRFIAFKLIHLGPFVSRKGTTHLMIAVTVVAVLCSVFLWRSAGVPAIAIVWSTLALVVLGWLALASTRTRVPWVFVVISWPLLLGAFNLDNHANIRYREASTSARDAKSALVDWVAERRSAADKKVPVFIVVAEGGGLRAAVMAAAVLGELRTRFPTFTDRLFAIIGISGGSVGVATFAAAIQEFPSHKTAGEAASGGPAQAEAKWRSTLDTDLLAPTIRAYLGSTIISQYIPYFVSDLSSWDRSRALEDAWSQGWEAATKTSRLRDLWFNELSGKGHGSSPKLIFMTTSVDDGEPMAISHLCNFGLRTLADVNPGIDIPLTTAAVMSARFPLISSTAHVPNGTGAADFVDGGYFENSGLTAVIRLIRSLRSGDDSNPAASVGCFCGPIKPLVTRKLDTRLENTSIIVIKIKNGSTEDVSGSQMPFFGLSSQLSTLYATGAARAAEARRTLDELVESSSAECAGKEACSVVGQITFSLSKTASQIPLGWVLSSDAHSEIVEQLKSECNKAAFALVGGALESGMPGHEAANCAR